MSEFTWLVHPDVGIPWQCPTAAVGFWTPRGYEVCDAPPEVDPTKESAANGLQYAIDHGETLDSVFRELNGAESDQPEATRAPESTAVVSDEADDTIEGTE